jgi:hypothetical protein
MKTEKGKRKTKNKNEKIGRGGNKGIVRRSLLSTAFLHTTEMKINQLAR